VEHGRSDYDTLIGPIEEQMMRSVWRIVRDPDDADDAFQEALANIWKRLERIRKHPNPRALILRICMNAAWDTVRNRMRRKEHPAADTILETVVDGSPSAAEQIDAEEKRREILRAIGELSKNQADAILMRVIQDQPYKDIADALGCSEVTARGHVNRARVRLREALSHLLPTSFQGGDRE
jgi:RNA polymerase sigma-70 factor (ECF subfamily)